ncbi:hypothetical protein [Daejeonella oryzae]|uniref:hypothetical protein n=1 Tax=Daejeonella oryzae TaxID=1122943 RepID=UPI000406AA17|nr:hypothetical protein [Daejeonella oryzae]
MKIFKRIKAPVVNDKIARQVASHIIKIQCRLADCMNKRVKKVPGRILLLALLLFTVTFGGYCLYLILNPFINH